MIVLIPAYEPTGVLVDLVQRLRAAEIGPVLVVDDGSGPAFAPVFAAAELAGAEVIGYDGNRGKGYALKAGFREIMQRWPGDGVVCADADGQHTVTDIRAVADRLAAAQAEDAPLNGAVHEGAASSSPAVNGPVFNGTAVKGAALSGPALIDTVRPPVVLGERALAEGVPLRSRVGNTATRLMVRLITGMRIHDTQTGLRGYPAALLPDLCALPGARYEYELNVLLHAHRQDWRLVSVPVSTVYTDGNASSHFRPLADSARVYAPLLKFCASSLTSFAVDAGGVLYLYSLTGSLLVAVVGARAVSSTVNYLINRRLVFAAGRDRPRRATAARYVAVMLVMLAANWAVLSLLTKAGLSLLAAKIVTDLGLFLVSYTLQHRMVFTAAARHDSARSVVEAVSR